MGTPPGFGGFSGVDATGEPARYADYLAQVRDMEAVREWKGRSVELLEPRPGMVLLDAGCGTGEDVAALAARVAPDGRAIGVDASRAMVEEARRRAHGRLCEFLLGDLARLPLPDASVDGARCERVLQHLDDPARAAHELARVVRPGRRVVLAEPDWGTLVIEGGDPVLAGEVALAAARTVRSPAVGRALRRLLVEAGLADVGVAARTLVLTDRDAAEQLLGLEHARGRAVADGRVGEAAAEHWRAGFAAAAERGVALAAMTAFMAWGRRR